VVGVGVGDGDVRDVNTIEDVEERRYRHTRVDEKRLGALGRVMEIGVDASGRDALSWEGDAAH